MASASSFQGFLNPGTLSLQEDLPFVKMQALGNDFIFVDLRECPYSFSRQEIAAICDRHVGIGGDQLMLVEPSPRTSGPEVYAFLRIFNIDGGEAGACGNATRCAAWLLCRESGRDSLVLETTAGRIACALHGSGDVSVSLGRFRTSWNEIPLSQPMDTLHLGIGDGPLQDPVGMNIGNTHAVFFVNDIDAVDLRAHGPALQNHPLFPEKANITVAQMIDPATIRLMVWERPGHLTRACGTGACVALGAARRRGLTAERKATVLMAAGSVVVSLGDDDGVVLTGPAVPVFAGRLLVGQEVPRLR